MFQLYLLLFWSFISISSVEVKLVKYNEGQAGKACILSIDDFLRQCRLHKGKATQKIPGWDAIKNPCSPLESGPFCNDVAKGAIVVAMQQIHNKWKDVLQHVELFEQPLAVKVCKDFKAGELVLPGVSPHIEKKAGKSTHWIGEFPVAHGQKAHFFAAPHFVAPRNNTGANNENPFVVPFMACFDR